MWRDPPHKTPAVRHRIESGWLPLAPIGPQAFAGHAVVEDARQVVAARAWNWNGRPLVVHPVSSVVHRRTIEEGRGTRDEIGVGLGADLLEMPPLVDRVHLAADAILGEKHRLAFAADLADETISLASAQHA